jgi:hypothetical protein
MVFCLIAIPLAALFGTSLPDMLKTLGLGTAGLDTAAVSAREQGGDAPLFKADIPNAAGVPDSPGADYENDGAAWPRNGPRQAEPPRLPHDMRTMQASFNEPAPLHGGAGVGRFEQIQNRLQALGATYFRLETFGSDRKLYRFQCEMPIVAAGAVQHFEATSENPLFAMESVLVEIDRWMTSGR